MTKLVDIQGRVVIDAPEVGFVGVGSRVTLRGFDAELAWRSRPSSGEIAWPGWTSLPEALIGKTIAADFADGHHARIELTKVLDFRQAEGVATFEIGLLHGYEYRPPGHGRASWVYSLLNLVIDGNLRVEESGAGQSPGWHRDAIRFEFAGRTWVIRDLLALRSRKERNDLQEEPHPIRSALLWTEKVESETEEDVDPLAGALCDLLSFAIGRCVRWEQRSTFTERGVPDGRMRPSIWCAPVCEGARSEPIDPGFTGNLALFIEAVAAELYADREWWTRTLGLHLQAVLSPMIDLRLTFFYVLLDRISRRILGTRFPPQIDAGLASRLADPAWKTWLHSQLVSFTTKWTEDRTMAVLNKIKEWNDEPGFVTKIQVTAEKLGLPKPDKGLVAPRHRVLHQGEPPTNLPPDVNFGDVSRGMQALITAMILRALGYTGSAYLPDAGRCYDTIHPWPATRPVPWQLPRDESK